MTLEHPDPPPLLARARDLLAARPGAVLAGPAAAALWIDEFGGVRAGDDREAHLELVPPLALAPLEIVVPGRGGRPMAGVRFRADELPPDEVHEVPGDGGVVRLTSPLRTAFDLARTLPLDEAVELVDAIGSRHVVWPDDLRRLAHRHPGVRGRRAVFSVADLIDHGSTSPARTRVRLVLRRGGIDVPRAGRAIVDADGCSPGSWTSPGPTTGAASRSAARAARPWPAPDGSASSGGSCSSSPTTGGPTGWCSRRWVCWSGGGVGSRRPG